MSIYAALVTNMQRIIFSFDALVNRVLDTSCASCQFPTMLFGGGLHLAKFVVGEFGRQQVGWVRGHFV